MTDLATARLNLPLLAVGQAQKEMFHNEAIVKLSALVAAVINGVSVSPPTEPPADGDMWIVDIEATGDWVGYDNHIALWTGGGWRFVEPVPGMSLTIEINGVVMRYRDNGWHTAASIDQPTGGSVVDVEARAVLSEILEILTARGWRE